MGFGSYAGCACATVDTQRPLAHYVEVAGSLVADAALSRSLGDVAVVRPDLEGAKAGRAAGGAVSACGVNTHFCFDPAYSRLSYNGPDHSSLVSTHLNAAFSNTVRHGDAFHTGSLVQGSSLHRGQSGLMRASCPCTAHQRLTLHFSGRSRAAKGLHYGCSRPTRCLRACTDVLHLQAGTPVVDVFQVQPSMHLA